MMSVNAFGDQIYLFFNVFRFTDVLEGHVVPGTYFTVGLSNDLELTTINNKVIRVTVNPDTNGMEINSFHSFWGV